MLNTNYSCYQDAPVPSGFETAYACFSREDPEAFGFLEDPAAAVAEGDHPDLCALARRHRLVTIEVEAPSALKMIGIETVTAFPIEVLRRFYG